MNGMNDHQFLAVVSTMFYLTTMVYDLKLMRSILIEKADLSNSVGIYDDEIEAIEQFSRCKTQQV